jgi:hypothetical protein
MRMADRYASALVLGLALMGATSTIAAQPGGDARGRGPAVSASASSSVSVPVVQVPAEIMVLHATNTDGGIDPRIGPLPQLKLPPFSAYNTYKLLDRHAVTLTTARPDTTTLPNGRVLRTTLKGMVPDDKYRVAASISRPRDDKTKEDTFLPLLEVTAKSGETFFVAGQSYRGGILVVGIRVGTGAKPPEKK